MLPVLFPLVDAPSCYHCVASCILSHTLTAALVLLWQLHLKCHGLDSPTRGLATWSWQRRTANMELPPNNAARGVHSRSVLSCMCSAALPVQQTNGRKNQSNYNQMGLGAERKIPLYQTLAGVHLKQHAPQIHGDRSRRNAGGFGEIETQPIGYDLKKIPFDFRRRLDLPEPSWTENEGVNGEIEEDSRPPNGNDGSSEPRDNHSKKAMRVKLAEVVSKVKDQEWRKRVRTNFSRKFYATSTLATKNSKRKKVMEILENLGEGPMPLTVDSITTVAAVLDSTGMKAGDQYLNEAKLLHVEAGYPWSDQLELKMTTCKRAMRRDKGPEVRAKELRLDNIPEELWEMKVKDGECPLRTAWSYAWASLWMLRAIEASNLRVKHVRLDESNKTVRLTIPKSKTDQRALGVVRTMKCCGLMACSRKCPYNLACRVLREIKSNESDTPLFPTIQGQQLPKVKLVEAWAKTLDPEISGHSARRSGAMMWTREGLNVSDISFLGRWKSSAVFRYIEDAMAELPLNRNGNGLEEPQSEPQPPEIPVFEGIPEPEVDRKPRKRKQKAAEDSEDLPMSGKYVDAKPLMAVSRVRKEITAHRVGQASWGIKLDEWTTICGWRFARRNVKVELTRLIPKQAKNCSKCEKIWSERDGVRGAREWAHQLDLKLWMQQIKMKLWAVATETSAVVETQRLPPTRKKRCLPAQGGWVGLHLRMTFVWEAHSADKQKQWACVLDGWVGSQPMAGPFWLKLALHPPSSP